MSHKTVPQECPTRMSYKSVLQECPTRVSYKSAPQECRQECPYKSVPQDRPTRVSVIQGVPQECTRVSHKGFRKACVLQGCPTKVSPTRVSKNCLGVCFRVRGIRVREFRLVFCAHARKRSKEGKDTTLWFFKVTHLWGPHPLPPPP